MVEDRSKARAVGQLERILGAAHQVLQKPEKQDVDAHAGFPLIVTQGLCAAARRKIWGKVWGKTVCDTVGAMALDPFEFVPLPEGRSRKKPRWRGLTMMIDWGLGMGRQRDILEIAGPFIDLAKIATGTSRLYQEHQLWAKLELYKKHNVRPFLGGQFQEYVFAKRGPETLPIFLEEAKRL